MNEFSVGAGPCARPESMDDWRQVKLGEVCDINIDSYTASDEWKYVNYLDTGSITEGKIDEIKYIEFKKEKLPSRARRKIEQGDIVYSTVRPNQRHYGIINNVLPNMLVSTGFAVLRGKETVCASDYIYFFLTQNGIVEHLQNIAEQTVSTYPAIKSSDIANILINLPPLPEQRAIAATLSCLDDKIELNRRINSHLEELAQAIFKRWFVDFEFPDENGQPYKSSDGAMVDSELGLIPAGWRVRIFDDICHVQSGGTPKTTIPEYWNGDIPFFTPKDAKDACYVFDTEKKVTVTGKNNCNSRLYAKDTVFITARGTVGKIALAGREMVMNQSCYALQGKESIDQYFLYFQTINAVEQLKKEASGAVFDAIIVSSFNTIRLAMPSRELLKRYFLITSAIFSSIHINSQENISLTSIRDTLLPKLMSGAVRVPVEMP